MQHISFLSTFLTIRFKQIRRAIWSVGWGLLLLAVSLFFFLILQLLSAVQHSSVWITTAVIVATIGGMHFYRKDVPFLKLLGIPLPLVFVSEYALLSFLICFPLWYFFGHWQTLVFGVGLSALLGFMPIFSNKSNALSAIKLSFLPLEAFEWRIGIRSYFYYLLPTALVGLGTTYFVAGALVMYILMGFWATFFYEYYEPKELLETIHFKQDILKRKVFLHSFIFQILLCPYGLLFLFFHFEYWYILLAAALIGNGTVLFALFYKYANYTPRKQRAYNQNVVGIFAFSFLVPFFWAGNISALFIYYYRARKRLNYFYEFS